MYTKFEFDHLMFQRNQRRRVGGGRGGLEEDKNAEKEETITNTSFLQYYGCHLFNVLCPVVLVFKQNLMAWLD